MLNSSDILKIASGVSSTILVGLATYLAIRGMPIPDWLTLVIGGAGGGGLVGIGHSIGVSTTENAAATLTSSNNGGDRAKNG